MTNLASATTTGSDNTPAAPAAPAPRFRRFWWRHLNRASAA